MFAPGEVLLNKGEQGNHALQILEGEVEISVGVGDQKSIITTRVQGDIIGELAIFSGGVRNATVTATHRTTVKLLTRDLIEREMRKLNPLISQMIKGLSDQFIERLQQINANQGQPKSE